MMSAQPVKWRSKELNSLIAEPRNAAASDFSLTMTSQTVRATEICAAAGKKNGMQSGADTDIMRSRFRASEQHGRMNDVRAPSDKEQSMETGTSSKNAGNPDVPYLWPDSPHNLQQTTACPDTSCVLTGPFSVGSPESANRQNIPHENVFMNPVPAAARAVDPVLENSTSNGNSYSTVPGNGTDARSFELTEMMPSLVEPLDTRSVMDRLDREDGTSTVHQITGHAVDHASAGDFESANLLADHIAAVAMDNGIFEVLLPHGEVLAVAVEVAPVHVRILLSSPDEILKHRLRQQERDLSRHLEQRIQKPVQMTVL